MKNFKKVLALVLAVATLLSFATIASAKTADFKDAKDVKNTEAVDILSAIGVLNGYKDGEYKPNRVITRAEAAKIIAMFDNGDTNIKELYAPVNFTDVASDAFYADAINWAVANNVTNGTSATTFSPNADCTRAEIVTFLYRAYQGK